MAGVEPSVDKLSRADEVLVLAGEGELIDANADSVGLDVGGNFPLVIGIDVEVLGIYWQNIAQPEFPTVQTTPGTGGLGHLDAQVTTRSEFAERGTDEEVPAGIMASKTVWLPWATLFEDATNGTGGASQSRYVSDEFIDPAGNPNHDDTLDEGQEVNIVAEITGLPAGTDVQWHSAARFWVREL